MTSTASLQDTGPGQWFGLTPTPWQIAAVLFAGSVAVLVAGVQPVLLGALHLAGRLGEAQIGQAATLELLTLSGGVVFGEVALDGRRLRPIVVVASLALALANLATLWCDGAMVLAMRALAGFPGGVLVWLTSAFIVRSPAPTRWSAIYLICQSVLQCAIAAGAGLLFPGDPSVVPLALALFALAALGVAGLVPARLAALPRETTVSGLPPPQGIAVLVVILFIQAAIVGAWVYVEPLGTAAGLTPLELALATPLSLASQLIGAGLAIVLSGRVAWVYALVVATGLLALVLLALSLLPGAALFLALEAVFGALWIFISPFFTPLALESDATRRTAVVAPSAVLLGSALGPLAASLVIGGGDAALAVRACAALALIALGLIAGLHGLMRGSLRRCEQVD